VDPAALRSAADRYLHNASAAILSAKSVDEAVIQRALAPLTETPKP
jgi:hypothetical protein